MAETLNITLTEGQLGWVRSRKEERGFTTASDVIRDLIRSKQDEEWRQLAAEFDGLDKDGAPGPEPEERIIATVRSVRRDLREGRGRA